MAVYLVSLARLAEARARSGAPPVAELGRVATDRAAPTDAPATSAAVPGPSPAPTPERPRKPSKSASGAARQPSRKVRAVKRTPTRARAETAKVACAQGEKSRATELVDGLGTTVEALLHLSRAQVGELLAACNEPTRKVLLALIYRLAAVEDELRSVSATVRSAGVRALQSASFTSPAPGDQNNDKTHLLEQVFQKNVSLRKRS